MRILLTILFTLILSQPLFGQGLYTSLEQWNGEYLQRDYGAVYTRVFLEKFPRGRGMETIVVSPSISVRHVQSGHKYVINQTAVANTTDPLQIWKIPAGDYTIEKITVNDSKGATRTWMPPKVPKFSIRYLFLSNLGDLRISPYGKGLRVKFIPQKNLYKNTYGHESFAGVIDAYSTKVQAKLGGGTLFKEAKDGFSTGDDARAAFSSTRTISMLYRLDSTGSQSTRRIFSSTLNAQDADLRRCYMEELDLTAGLRGSADFRFQLAPSGGTFSQIKYQGGDLRSPKAVQCLTFTLGKMQFPIRQRVQGRVTFMFGYKEDIGRSRP